MAAKKHRLFLVKSAAGMADSGSTHTTGAVVPVTGIYRVIHAAHRLPHEVSIFKGEVFPRCSKCADQVKFELVRAATGTDVSSEFSFRISVYELPASEDDELSASAS